VLVPGIVGDERRAPVKSTLNLSTMVTLKATRPINSRQKARQIAAHNQRQSVEKVRESLAALVGETDLVDDWETVDDEVAAPPPPPPPGLGRSEPAVVTDVPRPKAPVEHFPSLTNAAPPPPLVTQPKKVPAKREPSPPTVPPLEAVSASSTYVKANDFSVRNARLFDSIAKWLGKSTKRTRHLEENRVDTFKKCSRQYRQGESTADEYYAKVVRSCAACLHDYAYWRALRRGSIRVALRRAPRAHARHCPPTSAPQGARSADAGRASHRRVVVAVVGQRELANDDNSNYRRSLQTAASFTQAHVVCGLLVCKACGQVLRERDYTPHMTQHTQNQHFPSLGS